MRHDRPHRLPATNPTQSDTMTRNPTTQTETDQPRTEQRYTDTENTGTAAVPDLRPNRDERDERDDMDELVWSHRL